MSQRRRQNILLEEQIKEIYQRSRGRYGSPRIHAEIRVSGIKINKKRVAHLMKINGIRAITKQRFKATTDSNYNKPVAENLVNQKFQAVEPNKIWASDITYIRIKEGWLYLVVIMDIYSRMIVGWSMSQSISRVFVMTAINHALVNRNPEEGLIFHSDRGSQYASEDVRSLLSNRKFNQSMSGKGNCYDNAVVESFFSFLKN